MTYLALSKIPIEVLIAGIMAQTTALFIVTETASGIDGMYTGGSEDFKLEIAKLAKCRQPSYTESMN